VSTLRADATIHSSVVNAGVLHHPITSAPVIGLVAVCGSRKLAPYGPPSGPNRRQLTHTINLRLSNARPGRHRGMSGSRSRSARRRFLAEGSDPRGTHALDPAKRGELRRE